MTGQLGLGMAALGRPGYVTLTHAGDLGGELDAEAMESHAREVLDAAYRAGVRYYDMARSYGRAEDFFASWLANRGLKPGDVVVASKWGYTYTAGWKTSAEHHEIKDHSVATFTRQIGETLERLDGFLSRYQIHSVTAESRTLDDDALIDAIARLKDKGIQAGITTSGPGQAVAIRKCPDVRRDGVRVFDSVQATWNLLERGAESALSEAHDAGMAVVIKEALANGRLTQSSVEEKSPLSPLIERLKTISHARGMTLETVALAIALQRSWATIVLSGAATVDQLVSNAAARDFIPDASLEQELLSAGAIDSSDYWTARSGFAWN
jgi:aryl-alcohol dehydrogenase-like predicted oxidoreductase